MDTFLTNKGEVVAAMGDFHLFSTCGTTHVESPRPHYLFPEKNRDFVNASTQKLGLCGQKLALGQLGAVLAKKNSGLLYRNEPFRLNWRPQQDSNLQPAD